MCLDRYVVAEYNGMLFEGNEDLDPETVLAYELGMRLRSPARFRFETALFWNDMKDTFDFMMDEDGVFRTENVTASESYGVELSARIRLTDTVEGFADYTWTDGEYTEYSDPSVVGNDLVYLVHDLVHAGVDVDLTSRVEGTLFMVYSGEREGDVYNSEEARLDDYILFNAALRMEVLTATAITVSVENIFDETYSTFPGIEEPGTCYMAGISTAF
jgi:outer membrane receptor protein involved in Fe transport